MHDIPKSFLSPLLAQTKLRFSGNSNGGSTPQHSIIATNHCSNTMTNNSNISEIPTFHQVKEEEQYTDIGLPLSEVVATFARRAKSIYENFEISTRGKETLEKADKFGIEYDPNNIDFLTVLAKVREFEKVIARAEASGINWKHFGYHTITTLGLNCIKQIVEDEEREEEASYRKHAYLDFAATRGLEA
jgi:hypothetical protein